MWSFPGLGGRTVNPLCPWHIKPVRTCTENIWALPLTSLEQNLSERLAFGEKYTPAPNVIPVLSNINVL